MIIIKQIIGFLTNPKNTRMLLFAGIIIFLLLFLRQCGKTSDARLEAEAAKQEIIRTENNYAAALDTIRQGQLDNNTWRAEKLGYELTLDELNNKYSHLLGDFKAEKNKPPKVIISTVFEIKEVMGKVKVISSELDSNGNANLTVSDTAQFDSINYRYLNGKIPYQLVFNTIDSTYKIEPSLGIFELKQGMNLNVGLFQDKKTKQVSIIADTDYPGITFTSIEGASIMDDPDNKKILKNMRKNWGLGLSAGYGIMLNTGSNTFITGPYVGVSLNYQPKILQW